MNRNQYFKNAVRMPGARGCFRLAVVAGALAGQAFAGPFLYVANNTSVLAYGSDATLLDTFAPPSGGWSNALAVTVDSTGNVYVSDSGNGRIIEYTADGQSILATFNLPSTASASNQGIGVDSRGNLYVADFTSGIYEFTSPTMAISLTGATAAPTRDLLVDNNPFDASTNPYGGQTVFSTSGLSGVGIASFATGSVTATVNNVLVFPNYPAGQLRGIATDSSGNLYVADSTWFGGANGYIEKITPAGVTSVLFTGLSGPNEIQMDADGNTLYIADYRSGDVVELNTANPSAGLTTFVSGLGHVTGIAFAPGTGLNGLADFESAQAANAPEPGTTGLLLSAFALFGAIKARRATRSRWF